MRRTSRTRSIAASLLWMVFSGLQNTSAVEPAETEPERLLFLLEYIGADYGAAVHDGAIASPFEYQEMASFSDLLVEQFALLREHGAPDAVRVGLLRLRESIRNLAPWDDVRTLASELTSTLFDALEVVAAPVATPDLARGERLYASNCAACHGPLGAGDGFADPEMDPPANSLGTNRLNLISPHQVYGATFFGVAGTAMPAYRDALDPQELWDITFHVMTLRDGFEPAAILPEARPTLDQLVECSNEALLAWLADEGYPARSSDVDYFRRFPPQFRLPELAVANESPSPEGADPLQVAMQLQDAFANVAEKVLPSVVSVTSFVREDSATVGPDEGWEVEGSEARLYPGFRRLKSASGFFVSDDGYLLTIHSVVTRDDDGEAAEVLDVELPNGRHVLARLVGAEPTIDLAVLKLEVFSKQRPPALVPMAIGDSDAVRVGHWTIAVGDPWGPEQTYTVGTLAAPPGRQCYQEDLSGTLMQAALSVHPEAYGGPLVDIRGRVVGMTVPPPGGGGLVPRASEFALPIHLAMNIYAALKVSESRRSPWLGFSVLELAAVHRRAADSAKTVELPRTGVYIDGLFEPSPASRAGIRVGDCLVAIDGNRLFSVLDFQKWLYLSGIGRTVELELYRDGKPHTERVTVEERPLDATPR